MPKKSNEPEVVETKQEIEPVNQETTLATFKQGVDDLLAKREYFISQVLPKLKEKQDFHIILGKKSLSKGGAEKLASIYQLVATFDKDNDTVEMLSEVKGMVAYVCDLKRGGFIVGQGRGADTLGGNNGDPNKTIKMAQKRAYVDAVIRTTGLSDIFTQDMSPEDTNGYQKPSNEPTYHADPQEPVKNHYCQRHYSQLKEKIQITPAEASFSKKKYGFELCRKCQSEGDKAKDEQPVTSQPKQAEKPKSDASQTKKEVAQEMEKVNEATDKVETEDEKLDNAISRAKGEDSK
jgi:hypothetical protein|tara:strand:+ start:1674 stop:2549 length:876 start_codon:yes stop_codon:yes gene_type:complete